jgi:serine/threonine-protein kinase HipA
MRLEVHFQDFPLGLLNDSTGQLLFQYDDSFLRSGIELSPFYLSLQQGVIVTGGPFEGGLPGLFADSLPDCWGRTIMDRRLRESGIDPAGVSVLKRLAMLGDGGFGALSYHPAESEDAYEVSSLLEAVHFSRKVLETTEADLPGSPVLQQAGSNPGGRFPKLCVGWQPDEEKLVIGTTTLPSGYVPALLKLDVGDVMPQQKKGLCQAEYEMLRKAERVGIRVPDFRLLEGEEGRSHLLVERFDRKGSRRVHMHSFSGVAHKLPVRYGASYEELLRVVSALTHDQREVDEMFRRMVFNVLCGNRDDHVRNHAFLMDDDGRWRLSPAFDLTPTPEIPEQSLSVNGKWSDIKEADFNFVGNLFSVRDIDATIDCCRAFSTDFS